MHLCVWYTELTCISNGVSKTDIVVGKVQCVCVCVLTDGGATTHTHTHTHTHTNTHWTLPTTMSVLETPLQGALNHWDRIPPQGPSIQNNQLKKKSVCKNTRF